MESFPHASGGKSIPSLALPLYAGSERTLWRETIKNQYFTAYTQGYYSAAAWHEDHCYICYVVESLQAKSGLDPKFRPRMKFVKINFKEALREYILTPSIILYSHTEVQNYN